MTMGEGGRRPDEGKFVIGPPAEIIMLINTVKKFLQSLPNPISILIAYSGGMDSHVLLHALAQCGVQQVRAVHLNHGLNSKAREWQLHSARICAHLKIPFITHELNLTIQKGESLEAVARAARYDYFAHILKPNEILCTAHHQDDQLETVLLQLLRGAGPKGLAAMAHLEPFAAGYHARPLLNVEHDSICTYAREHELHWMIDGSNANIQFDRNFMRHDIIPLLKQRFPSAAETVSRSAMHCASTQQVFENYLKQELSHLTGQYPDTLSRKKLLAFDTNTQHYLLRTWLMAKQMPMPSTAQLLEIQKLLMLKNDAKALVTWQGYSIRFYRDDLFAQATDFFAPPDPQLIKAVKLVPSPLGKLNPDILQKDIKICFRQKGDSLKKTFQELNIPPWLRWQLPMLYVNNELAAIADHWISPHYACKPEKSGLALAFCL